MRVVVLVLMTLLCSCAGEVSEVPDQEKDVEKKVSIVPGIWVFFSLKTFPTNDVRGGMSSPNVSRTLTPTEEAILDSIIQGYIAPVDSASPKVVTGCYWPKHAVQYLDSTGATRTVNICFECGRTRSDDEILKKIPIEAWEYFYSRIGWPVRTGYADFFERAKTDTVFSKQKGTFKY